MESGNSLPTPGNYPDGDRQQFCVSWNSHQSNMHNAFPKLLSSEQFVDVTLACDGGSIKCHKVVLSACSDYLERLLLEIPCTHPIIFLRDMRMWELQALVEFMYRGEVYVEQQQLAKLMQAADVLQIRGLSNQGRDLNQETSTPPSISSTHSEPTTPIKKVPQAPPSMKEDIEDEEDDEEIDGQPPSDDPIAFLENSQNVTLNPINNTSITVTPTDPPVTEPSNFLTIDHTENIEHTEALQHLEKALSSCEATMTETPGMVKMEPDEQFFQQDKPYSISMVPTSNNCNTTNNSNSNSPFPAIEGYQRRQRRSEAELKLASDMVARGKTFQVASEKYNIPISTIRFYMVRKGLLQRRKRGRGSTNIGASNSQPGSPATPPFHMMNYRLPESLNSTLQ
ncbi:probable serine/threonine-protein kinase mkcB [Microplitis demolitor]|uniref:probable serine/threonine-protein kinase mkcB n=1 Tax=Microplitis demolitor TaxID=69319 RepID=UPI00043FFFBB|nr:probable serine/threonine-protein kinase mkcB [Microplitis demolitor]XP_008557967.1 probable serine/threonine-protein kinase mkcB [Microplitis demolitor]XP_008557975.1 probable serine/threonine-protein kinase mkcB [Microplitis demolitor]XP_008557983.1 probable serine/threonine-protein kinase mkcB [Microplitis demolitor]XP_008557990.1 probable serine/threonine-protein kinase mkcB [Microplitis demolitor]XP_014300529.1 probable serine/threonine-protein kinase mkcB [Microplitis demolitor]